MARPCHCNGSNETCTWCCGTGTIEDNNLPHVPCRRTSGTGSRKRMRFPGSALATDESDSFSGPSGVGGGTEPVLPPPTAESSRLARCTTCGVLIARRLLGRHLNKFHPAAPRVRKPSREPASSSVTAKPRTDIRIIEVRPGEGSGRQWTACPTCKERVRKKLLERHVRLSHPTATHSYTPGRG